MYCSAFKDDVVGQWVARHGLTSAQYQTEFDTQNAVGFTRFAFRAEGQQHTHFFAVSLSLKRAPRRTPSMP